MNLIQDAESILNGSRKDYSSIKTKTDNVFRAYIKYMQSHEDLLPGNIESLVARCDEIKEEVLNLLKQYLMGNHRRALDIAKSLLSEKEYTVEVSSNTAMFRSRANDGGYLYKQEEMWHVPLEKRGLVTNQRFSVNGLPCLYLGGASYICWEEIGRPDCQKCNHCCFKTTSPLRVYDFCLPQRWMTVNDVYRSVLILACSIKTDKNDIFKQEYILPQCFLQAVIEKQLSNSIIEPIGIRYHSTKLLNGETDLFKYSGENDDRYINYVFPVISSKPSGISEVLKKSFIQSKVTSIMAEIIKDPSAVFSANDDEYLDSNFGFIDSVLLKSLGLPSKRVEADMLLCEKD